MMKLFLKKRAKGKNSCNCVIKNSTDLLISEKMIADEIFFKNSVNYLKSTQQMKKQLFSGDISKIAE